jgi:endoglucanase
MKNWNANAVRIPLNE